MWLNCAGYWILCINAHHRCYSRFMMHVTINDIGRLFWILSTWGQGPSVWESWFGRKNWERKSTRIFCIENNTFFFISTIFPLHFRRLYIRQFPENHVYPHQKHWKSSIKVLKPLSGAGIESDNQLLIAYVRVKLKRIDNSQKVMRFNLQNISKQYILQ